jgi:hypothetical protein
VADLKFVFTITPGHSGTTWLAELFRRNLDPSAAVHHEILGYDKFGVDTPYLSHMTRFNSEGNVKHIRDFWAQKASRILTHPGQWYVETSHLLSKCGLFENIDLFTEHGRVFVICLSRDLLALVRSMRRRFDMINKGNQWLWHLDPDYPRKLVAKEFFMPYGVDGARLWYGCEMRARAGYYRQLLGHRNDIEFYDVGIENLDSPAAVSQLLQALDLKVGGTGPGLPPKANTSGVIGESQNDDSALAALISSMQFEPTAIAKNYLEQGFRLGG